MSEKEDKKKPAPKKTKAQPELKKEVESTSTDLSVGEILRRARVAEKLSLERVEDDIRIRAFLLQAIEDMDLEKMPGWIYTIGFVRSYSDYLNLDSDKMIALLKTQVGDRHKQKLDFPVVASESAMPSSQILIFTGTGLVLLILGAFIYQTFMNSTETSQDVNAIPPVTIVEKYAEAQVDNKPQQTNSDNASEVETPVELQENILTAPRDENGVILPMRRPDINIADNSESQSLDDSYRVIIDVIDESWVEIRDSNGNVLVSRVLKVGDQYYVPQSVTGLEMTTGNIAGIEITVDGEKLSVKGQSGDIRRNIPLDPESLKEMFP